MNNQKQQLNRWQSKTLHRLHAKHRQSREINSSRRPYRLAALWGYSLRRLTLTVSIKLFFIGIRMKLECLTPQRRLMTLRA